LGLDSSVQNVHQPKEVHVPAFKKDNYINEIFPGFKQTAFMTTSGKIYITALKKPAGKGSEQAKEQT